MDILSSLGRYKRFVSLPHRINWTLQESRSESINKESFWSSRPKDANRAHSIEVELPLISFKRKYAQYGG